MEVANHIRDLLYHHDCVVVPGFGGFVTNERPARIDKVSGSFSPPSREVGFNARLDHNDGLLISCISSRMSLNYVDAKKLVTSFVEKVKGKLLSGRIVQFEGIGQFTVDRDHNIHFDPDPSANFLTGAYGLSSFRYMPANRALQPAVPSTPFLRRILRYAAITIPMAAFLGWGAMNSGMIQEFNFSLSSLNPFSAVISQGYNIPVETASRAGSFLETELDEMSSLRRAMMYVEEDAAAEQHQFNSHHLVAGSFRSMQNALLLGRQLEAKGYEPGILEAENGMYRVTVFSSESRLEALRMLRQIRSAEDIPDIWLLSN